MKVVLVLVVVAAILAGCFTASPNLLFVDKGGIKAEGTISRRREQIGLIEINPRELSEAQIHDLWIGLSSTNHAAFADITENAIKRIGTPSTNYYSAPSTE